MSYFPLFRTSGVRTKTIIPIFQNIFVSQIFGYTRQTDGHFKEMTKIVKNNENIENNENDENDENYILK